MIAKVSRGSSGRGLIRYLFGPGRANEHTDQRVITSGLALGVEVLAGRGLSTQEIADLGADLDEAKEAFAVDTKAGHLYHLSLSLPATDRQVTDDQWTEIAQKAMEALGFEREGLVPAAWVAIGHGVSTNGNQHIHLAASMIRTDGSLVDIWQDRKTLSRVCAEVEGAFELTVVRGRAEGGMPGLSRAELDRTERERRAVPARFTLARRVREASVASKDEAEFVRRLRAQGVLVRPRFETGGMDAVVGYSIALRTTGGDTPIFYGGGKLAKDLTLPRLRQFWEQSPSDRNEAVAEWRATESVTPGRESVLGAADNWQQAVAGAERIVETLRALPVSDLAAWRGAAREAAGVFAGWSRRFEGDSSGPMGSAADALARSAQSGPGDPVANRDAVRDFRAIAAIVAQSELKNDSPIAWAMLVDQLGRTLRAISDAHVARGETETAKALVDRLSGELGELHHRFETSAAKDLVPTERTEEDRVEVGVASKVTERSAHQRHRGREPGPGRGLGR